MKPKRYVIDGYIVEQATAVDEITSAMKDGLDVAQAKVDARLQDIVPPEQFAPWPERYGTKGGRK